MKNGYHSKRILEKMPEKEKADLLIPIPEKSATDSEPYTGRWYRCIWKCQFCLMTFVLLLGVNILSLCVILPNRGSEYVKKMQKDCSIHPNVIIFFADDTSRNSKDLSMQISKELQQVICKENYFKTVKQPVGWKRIHFDTTATDTEYDSQNGHNRKMSLKSYDFSNNLNNIKIEPVLDESNHAIMPVTEEGEEIDYDLETTLSDNENDDHEINEEEEDEEEEEEEEEEEDEEEEEEEQKVIHPDSATEDIMSVTGRGEEIDYDIEKALPNNENDDHEMDEETENETTDDRKRIKQKVVHSHSAAEDNRSVTEESEEIYHDTETNILDNENDDSEMKEEADVETNSLHHGRFLNLPKFMPRIIRENDFHYAVKNEKGEKVQDILYELLGEKDNFMPLDENFNVLDEFMTRIMNKFKEDYINKDILNEKKDDIFDDKNKDIVLKSKAKDNIK